MAMPIMSIFDHQLNDATHNRYDVTFYQDTIATVVTKTPSCVDTWISEIQHIHKRRLRSLIVGLDVEWRPNLIPNVENPVATLQLCVGRRCLIFQILHCGPIPSSLKDFLANTSYTFAGVGIANDVQKLRDDYNLIVARTADLRELAADAYGDRNLMTIGLKALVRRVLGKELNKPKPVTLSRWDNQWLNPAQVQYACIDAFLSFEIGRVLITGHVS